MEKERQIIFLGFEWRSDFLGFVFSARFWTLMLVLEA